MYIYKYKYICMAGWNLPTLKTEFGELSNVIAVLPSYYTLHPTPYTLHPTPYALHATPYTLHP